MSSSNGDFALFIDECLRYFIAYYIAHHADKTQKVMEVRITNSDGRNTGRRLLKLRIHTKNTAVWVVTPYSPVETCRRLGGTYCIKLQAFWWNVLHPTSGVLVELIYYNVASLHNI